MHSLEDSFNKDQENSSEEFEAEQANIMSQNQKDINELLDILFAMEQRYLEQENDAKTEFQSMRDEIKNKVL